MKKPVIQYVMVMIAMCGLVGGSIGVCSGTAGIFYSAVCADLDVSSASISFSYTLTALTAAFTGLLIPRIMRNEKNLKPLLYVGSVLCVGGTFLLAASTDLITYYLYCFVRGVGAGLLNTVLATSIINQWFLAKNAIMISIALAFSGLPGVLLSSFFSSVIESSGWRFGYIIVGIVLIIFFLPSLVFPISMKPADKGLKPYGYEEYLAFKEANPDKAVITGDNEVDHMFAQEIILLMTFTILGGIIASVLQHLPGFALSLGLTAGLGALMTSFASASNIISKIIYGVISDKLGPYKSSVFYAGLNVLSVVIMMFIHEPIVMIICSFLFGFTFANSSSAISIITRDAFGFAQYTKVYPGMSFACAAANAFGVALLGLLYDLTGSYYSTLLFCIIGQVIIILCAVTLERLVKKSAAS